MAQSVTAQRKLQAAHAMLDRDPCTTLPELMARCGIKSQHTAIKYRRLWQARAARSPPPGVAAC